MLIFDLEDILNHFGKYHNLQFFERISENNPEFNCNMKIYNRKMILDFMVDHFDDISSNIRLEPGSMEISSTDTSVNAQEEVQEIKNNEIEK